MVSAEDSIRPDFRPEFLSEAQDEGKDTAKNNEKDLKQKAARDNLREVEKLTSPRGAEMAVNLNGKQPKSGNSKLKKAAPAAILGVFLLVFGVIVAVVAVPMLVIGAIDYNLQRTLGFTGTVEIIEEQAINIVSEMAMNGELPDGFADQLASSGINFGQVTASGDFVRTNKYLANLDGAEVATIGSGFQRTNDGELAILFEGELIAAEEFPEKVNENPRLLLAFSDGADISARFYYSNAVNEVYDEMKISRNNFKDWEPSGSEEQDAENFKRIVEQMLNSNATIETNGYNRAWFTEDYNRTYSSASGSGHEIIADMREAMRDDGQNEDVITGQVSELLSLAVSSAEPYLAANAFMAIEEPIQRARIDGDGPVNELMNMISLGNEVEYTDVESKTTKTASVSILDTGNFQGAVSDSGFDVNEALSFSRDRILLVTDTGNSRITNPYFVSTENNSAHQPAQASEGHPKSNMVQTFHCNLIRDIIQNGIKIGEETLTKDAAGCNQAKDIVFNAEKSIDQVLTDKNSELFQSIVGGNRIVEGGSYITNLINQRTLGAMPADDNTVVAYNSEVSELLARKDAAEAAVKSPFDISSPNTFLGRIVHNLGMAAIKNSSIFINGGSLIGTTATVSSLASSSTSQLLGTASADGADKFYEVIGNGDVNNKGGNCPTVSEVNAACTLYGSSHNIIDTSRIDNKLSDWKNELSGNIDSNGEIIERSELSDFVLMGMFRDTTVGLDSGEVCERWKNNNLKGLRKIWDGIKKFIDREVLNGAFHLYDSCKDAYADSTGKYVPNGTAYTFGNSHAVDKLDKFSGYALYSTTRSLIEESETPTTAYMHKYLEQYPLDNSDSGWLARISGMTKGQAELVLAYVEDLNEIANYNPAERYVFGGHKVEIIASKSFVKTMMDENEQKVALMALIASEGNYRKIRSSDITA